MKTQNKILTNNEAQTLIDALKPETNKAVKPVKTVKPVKAVKPVKTVKPVKAAGSTKAIAAQALKDKAKKERENAAARVAESKAIMEQARADFEAKQAEKKADFIKLRTLIHDNVSFVSDEHGIIGTEIARLYLVSTQAKRVMFEEINQLPLADAIERLNQAYACLLDDAMKESFKKNIQNVTTPSNMGKRFTLSNHVGKIGRDNKKGVYIDISNVDNSHKAKGGKVQGAVNKAKSVKTSDLKESTVTPQAPVDTDKPASQISTVVHSEPLVSGTDARKRLVAQFIVTAIDQFSLDELEYIIMELDEHVTKNRIVLKAVING